MVVGLNVVVWAFRRDKKSGRNNEVVVRRISSVGTCELVTFLPEPIQLQTFPLTF